MPWYVYECADCGLHHEAERSIADRHDVSCPCCGAPWDRQQIQIQTVRGMMAVTPEITTEAAIVAEKGKDWRETPGSRRMADDQPERLYSAPGDVTRRHTKK